MCSGQFIDADKLDVGVEASAVKSQSQVALGCMNGAIYILHNFTVGIIIIIQSDKIKL